MAPLRRSQHTFTGVYALDALDTDADVARFERHMARCQSCTSEVRGFRVTAMRLGMAVSREPPPALPRRVAVSRNQRTSLVQLWHLAMCRSNRTTSTSVSRASRA